MLLNYQFILRKINEQYFLFYCLNFVLFVKCCFCATYDDVDLPNFGDGKVVSIDPEEIIRRQNIAEIYLKERGNSKKDWIETYHDSISRSSVFTPGETKQESSPENESGNRVTFPFQNVDLTSLEKLEDSGSLYESIFSGIKSGENSMDNLKKTDELTSEEFIRRRNIFISHHTSYLNVRKYENNPEIIESKNSFDNMYQPVDKSTKDGTVSFVKVADQTLLESLKIDKSGVDKSTKDKSISFEKITDQTLQKPLKTDKNGDVNQDLLKCDSNQISNSHGSKEMFLSRWMESKSQTKSNKLRNFSSTNLQMSVKGINKGVFKIKPEGISSARLTHKGKSSDHFLYSKNVRNDMFTNYNVKDYKFAGNIKCPSIAQDDDLEMIDFKNFSVNTDKIIEIMIKNSQFTSKKYFINGETLTLTEFYKLQDNLAQLSFLQKSESNVYSVNRMKMIDSIGNITLQQNNHNREKLKQLCKFSKTDNDIASGHFNYIDSNVKESISEFEKRIGHRVDTKSKATQNRIKDSSLSDTTKNEKFMILESTDMNDFSHDSEILRRKKSMNSFLTTLQNNQENWIETYHLSYLKDEPEINLFSSPISNNLKNKNSYSQKKAKQAEKLSDVYSQERLYIIRWINKLQNKFKDSYNVYHSLNILVSADLYKILGELSHEFDIVIFDELVNSIISNATFHNNHANTFYFNFGNIFNSIISSINFSTVLYTLIVFLLCFILLYSPYSNNKRNWILLLLTLIILSFAWNAKKMYQQKIAEKHTVMSRVVPAYCESILIQESGILAHFKEHIRSWWHDEDCKKYYEAVMVDPSAEITFLSISSDLLSDAIFQMLQPLGRNMNSFIKVLTYDLSFTQQVFIIVFVLSFLIFISKYILYFWLAFLAFCFRYKINFAFDLGSTEPTEYSIGSTVEEISEKEDSSLKILSTSCNTSLINYNNKTENKNHIEDIILQENYFKVESEQFKFKPSKYCVFKTREIGTRRNSF